MSRVKIKTSRRLSLSQVNQNKKPCEPNFGLYFPNYYKKNRFIIQRRLLLVLSALLTGIYFMFVDTDAVLLS